MQAFAKIVSFLALLGIVVPPALYLVGHLGLDTVKLWMLGATVLWFASVPFWMGRSAKNTAPAE